MQASQLEAKAAENAIEAAKLEAELLECERESMTSELQQVLLLFLTICSLPSQHHPIQLTKPVLVLCQMC